MCLPDGRTFSYTLALPHGPGWSMFSEWSWFQDSNYLEVSSESSSTLAHLYWLSNRPFNCPWICCIYCCITGRCAEGHSRKCFQDHQQWHGVRYTTKSFICKILTIDRYSSNSFSVFLGLYNSMTTLMALDGPTHLAEELPSPKRIIPRILVITITSQAILGVIWILVLGFSISNLQSIIATPTG